MLKMSQPALSKRLQILETLTGELLLERSPRGVSLTQSGSRLYIEARKLLTQAEAIEDLMGGLAAHESPIKLAASHTIAEFVLPGLLVDFESQHDHHLSVELLIGNSGVARALVADGSAEVGIAAAAPGDLPTGDELTVIPFLDDEIVVAVPRTHRWFDLKRVPLEQFLTTPLILRDPGADSRGRVDRVLEEHGMTLAIPVAEMGSTSAITSTAVSENVPAMLSWLALGSSDLAIRRVQGLRFPRRFAMMFGRSEESLPQATRTLVNYVLDNRPAERQPTLN